MTNKETGPKRKVDFPQWITGKKKKKALEIQFSDFQ